jgi:hypothetical protein
MLVRVKLHYSNSEMAMKGKGLEIESQLVHGVYQLSRSLNIAAEGQTKKAFNQQSSRDAR